MIRKKQPFVLLEVMIAFALVSAAVLPFFRHPFQQMRQELTLLFEMELERYAQNKLVQLHEQLHKQELPSELIFSEKQQKAPLENHLITVEISPNFKRKYEEKVFVTWKKQKASQDRLVYALVQLNIQYRKPKKNRILLQATSEAVVQKKI